MAAAGIPISELDDEPRIGVAARRRFILLERQQRRIVGKPLKQPNRLSGRLEQRRHRLDSTRTRRAISALVRHELFLSAGRCVGPDQHHQRLQLLHQRAVLRRRDDGSVELVAQRQLLASRRSASATGQTSRHYPRIGSGRADNGESSLSIGRCSQPSNCGFARIYRAAISRQSAGRNA